jgi:uncharacterized Zn-finger protein
MSLFVQAMGNKIVEVNCPYCHKKSNIQLRYFVDSVNSVSCSYCKNKIGHLLGIQSSSVIYNIKNELDQLEILINDLGVLHLG